MKIHHSIAIASVISAGAIALALTPENHSVKDCQHRDYEYASTIQQNCVICDATGSIRVDADSVIAYQPCPACSGSGKIIAQQYK